MEPLLPAYQRLSLPSLAKLLHISVEDMKQLRHLPLEADRNSYGDITGFHMKISTHNNLRLLAKINYDDQYTVRFTPEAVYKLYIQH